MSDPRSDSSILRDILESHLSEVATAMPGVITAYNSDSQTVDVDLQVGKSAQTSDDEIYTEDIARLLDVPVLFPRGGGYFITFPLAPGDHVLVVFCTYDIG